jgi:tRNA threonylcarbamoyl adenosine modification protein (Sua5/YciO/YrdC/YwlC family)
MPQAMERLKKSLQNSQVSVVSTDTILGLIAPLTYQGFEQLNAIKKRFEKPYLVMIADVSKVPLFVKVPVSEATEKIIKNCWPGPLTLILPAREDVPDFIGSSQKSIALRVPDHTGLRMLLQNFDGLFSTSANKTGAAIARTVAEVDADILDASALVVVDDNDAIAQVPSTIIDCTRPVPILVREGAYTRGYIEDIIGIKID